MISRNALKKAIPAIIAAALTLPSTFDAVRAVAADAPAAKPAARKASSQAPAGAKIDPARQTHQEIKSLLDLGVDSNARDEEGVTPLMKAAYLGQSKTTAILVENGADIKAKDANGSTPLHYAVFSGSIDTVRAIVGDHDLDINAADSGGVTPLMAAAQSTRDDVEVINYLLGKGADPNRRDMNGLQASDIAYNRGNAEAGALLASRMTADPTVRNALLTALAFLVMFLAGKLYVKRLKKKPVPKFMEKPVEAPGAPAPPPEEKKAEEKPPVNLVDAVASGDLVTLKTGLDQGGDPDTVDKSGWTLLMNAANKGYGDIVALLVERGANVNFQDNEGRTPLMNSVYWGKIETARLLIGSGADVNLRDVRGQSAYRIASDKGNHKLANLLKVAGAADAKESAQAVEAAMPDIDLNFNPEQNEKLRSAAGGGDADGVSAAIAAGADVNSTDASGVTALMLAAGTGRLDIIKVLIEAGAGVNASNSKGLTPLIIAAGKGQAKAVIILIKAGADFNARTKGGASALSLARDRGHEDVIKVLAKVGAEA